ncbi:unnamed protein product, partial [marine sediment metagenome]
IKKELGLHPYSKKLQQEVATLEAQRDVAGATPEEVGTALDAVSNELRYRELPTKTRRLGKSRMDWVRHPAVSAYRTYTIAQLEEMERVYSETLALAEAKTITGEIPEVEVTVEGLEPVKNIRRIDTRFREKQATYAQTKKQLVDYVNEHLPKEVRGKMLASVKNVKTELDLTKAIAQADKYAEQYAQKTITTQITSELKKITPRKAAGYRYGRFTPETQ